MAAKSGKEPDELVSPEVPEAAMYLWNWFTELSECRGSAGFGPGAISYDTIAAWARLTGTQPSVWEVKVIRALDRVFLKHSARAGDDAGSGSTRDHH